MGSQTQTKALDLYGDYTPTLGIMSSGGEGKISSKVLEDLRDWRECGPLVCSEEETPLSQALESPRFIEITEYRNQQPEPTEPGIYWAKRPWWPEIEPVCACRRQTGEGLVIATFGKEEWLAPSEFVWFGKIPSIQEG